MREENLHVADEQLLLHASGEMPASSSGRMRAHLECCPQCRVRLAELESTLAEFGEARKLWAGELPPGDGARALLKARLAEKATQDGETGWLQGAWLAVHEHRGATALASVGIAVFLLLAAGLHRPVGSSQAITALLGHGDEPDLRLTPGATVPVTGREVCGAGAEREVPAIPVSLRRKVFEEYGMTPPRPDAYEVDYLITPELGGATDIRNLWPEPYQETVWNARVKDQLEDRLHQMVCHGDLDLTTAQRDISTDWIAAYRKYFHADKPVANSNSSSNISSFNSLPRT